MPIVNRIAEFHEEMTAWRRHLHSQPELGYQEQKTAKFIAEKLQALGVDEVHTGLASTGVVGVIRGNQGDKAVGLRADIDALPIRELTDLPYASETPGKMHACGHDGHTTMLLGAARYLAETRNFNGTVYVIFQPAEEGGGGAKAMMDDGLFERFPLEQVYGLHNWPGIPIGQFAMCPGPSMAAADEFIIEIHGTGCHAAMPHAGRDPLIAGCQLVQAFQTVVSRQIDPIDNAVVSVTKFHAGEAYNVVPETCSIGGTVRTFQAETRDYVEGRLREISSGIAATFGLQVKFDYRRGYPPTINHEREATIGANAAAEIVGENRVDRQPDPAMGAEDFAYMLQSKPGSYIWMGTGDGVEPKLLHSPYFDFNDDALVIGASYWAKLVEQVLPRSTAN